MRECVDVWTALGKIRVEKVAEWGEDGAEQDRWKAPELGEKIAAETDPDHRHDDSEDLRRERDLVLRVVKIIEIEGVSEARPDIVADRVGQDESDRREHAPAHATAQFGQRINQR